MSEKRAVIRVVARRYRQAKKTQKGRIRDELMAVTAYHRFYAATPLKLQGRRVRTGAHGHVAGVLGLHAPAQGPGYTPMRLLPSCA